jgi:hypothetical protein
MKTQQICVLVGFVFVKRSEENRSKILELKLPDRTAESFTMIPDTAVFGFTLIDTGAVLFLLIYFVSFNQNVPPRIEI